MNNEPNNNNCFDVNDICNYPELIDGDTVCRLHRHGLSLFLYKENAKRYKDVVKDNARRVRPRAEIDTVLVGFDKPFVERGKIKSDTDTARVNNYFRLNNIDKDSVVWFAVSMTEDIDYLVTFNLVTHDNPKMISHYNLAKNGPLFFYVKRIEIESLLGVKKLNKNHVNKIKEMLQWELAELSANLNTQSYCGEVKPVSNHNFSRRELIDMSKSVHFYSNDVAKNSLSINKIIDRLLLATDNETSQKTKVTISVTEDAVFTGDGADSFLHHLKVHHALSPTIGSINFDEINKTFTLNINMRSFPPFVSIYNKHVNSLYHLMQKYLEKAIEKDSSLDTCRWAFSEQIFVSVDYSDWSAVLLTALFETLTDANKDIKIISVETA